MDPISSETSTTDEGPSDIRGQLTIDGERKSGVYGAYWSVVIRPDGDLPPVHATLSEKVWARTGLPPIDSATTARVTARRNAGGRWNVIEVDAGPRALIGIPATVIALEHETHGSVDGARQPAIEDQSQKPATAACRFRLEPKDAAAFETRVLSRVLNQLGICSLPVGHKLTADWRRESWGWKLNRIDNASLRAFFSADEANGDLPIAKGHPDVDWCFDDRAKDLSVVFDTAIPGLALRCRLFSNTLRNAGIRALGTDATITARLSLREGRWWIAELLDPRPDRLAHRDKEILYAVETRFAFQEENNFGELVNWLDIQDEDLGIGVTSLAHAELVAIDEGNITPGAHIVCDLKRGKRGWYASRIHRIADQTMVPVPHTAPQKS